MDDVFARLGIKSAYPCCGYAIVGIVKGLADQHYGFYFQGSTFQEAISSNELATTEAERVEMAKVPFEFAGVKFDSREQVTKAAEYFEANFGFKTYNNENDPALLQDLTKSLDQAKAPKKLSAEEIQEMARKQTEDYMKNASFYEDENNY